MLIASEVESSETSTREIRGSAEIAVCIVNSTRGSESMRLCVWYGLWRYDIG